MSLSNDTTKIVLDAFGEYSDRIAWLMSAAEILRQRIDNRPIFIEHRYRFFTSQRQVRHTKAGLVMLNAQWRQLHSESLLTRGSFKMPIETDRIFNIWMDITYDNKHWIVRGETSTYLLEMGRIQEDTRKSVVIEQKCSKTKDFPHSMKVVFDQLAIAFEVFDEAIGYTCKDKLKRSQLYLLATKPYRWSKEAKKPPTNKRRKKLLTSEVANG